MTAEVLSAPPKQEPEQFAPANVDHLATGRVSLKEFLNSLVAMQPLPANVDGNWAELGNCQDTDPDALFVQGAAQNRAKLICTGCPVWAHCLREAFNGGNDFGVWGGKTERERRALRRRFTP